MMKILSEGIALFEDVFLQNEELIALAEAEQYREGTVGAGEVDHSKRITLVHDLREDNPVHEELLQTVIESLTEYAQKYKVNIKQGEQFRIGKYPQGAYYKDHIDNGGGRTLSIVLFLNNDFEGGELYFNYQQLEVKPKAGSLVVFPSNFMYRHECKEITKGQKFIVFNFFG